MNARSLWALEKHKGKWIRRLFFCVFSLHWRPRFYCHAASPEPPRRALSKKCKQSSETPRFLSPLQGSHGLAGMQAVGLVRLSYVPHSKNGWALHENWLSNWKWKVMLKCTIMNGFCGPLLLPTSRQVLAPSNLLLHSLTVAWSRWRSSSSSAWRRTAAAAGAAPMLERFEDARWWIPTPCWRPWCSA